MSAAAESDATAFGDALRFDYYDGRLHSAGAPKAAMAELAGAMTRARGWALAPSEAAGILAAMPADPLAAAPAPEEVLRNAYEAGVLVLNEAGHVAFGIPSFRDYLAASG